MGSRNAVSLDRLKTEAKNGEYDAIIHVGGKACITFCGLSLDNADHVIQMIFDLGRFSNDDGDGKKNVT